MKITYDVEYLPERKSNGGKKSEEVIAVIAFLAGKRKNMRIEYDDAKQAKTRCDTIRGYRCRNKLQGVFDVYRHDNCVYVLRSKKNAG